MTSARLPHSETPGSKSGCRLPEAYRRLPRPSSAPDAKASTVRPKKLEHTTTIRNCKTRETPPTPPPEKGAEKKWSLPVKRCSRPLYSSQTTTSTPSATPLQGQPQEGPEPRETATPHPPPKKEGRAARFLRTQQRVHPAPQPVRQVPTPLTREGRY